MMSNQVETQIFVDVSFSFQYAIGFILKNLGTLKHIMIVSKQTKPTSALKHVSWGLHLYGSLIGSISIT